MAREKGKRVWRNPANTKNWTMEFMVQGEVYQKTSGTSIKADAERLAKQ